MKLSRVAEAGLCCAVGFEAQGSTATELLLIKHYRFCAFYNQTAYGLDALPLEYIPF